MRIQVSGTAILFLLLAAPPARAASHGPWTEKASTAIGPYSAALVAIDERLYLVGAQIDRGVVAAYDPRRDSWKTRAAMPTARSGAAVGVWNGLILTAGGGGRAATSVFEVYDPAKDSWASLPPLPLARPAPGAMLGGLLYVAGGNASGYCTDRVDAYDPAARAWRQRASLPVAACSAAAVAFGGRLYVIGGTNTTGAIKYGNVWIYDPSSDAWSAGAPMPTPRDTFAAAALDGRIYAIGGHNGAHLTSVEAYDPVLDAWFEKTPLPAQRFGAAAGALRGIIYVAGGALGDSSYATSVLAYDPRRDPVDRRVSTPPPPPRRPAVVSPAPPPVPPADPPPLRRGPVRPDDFALVVGIDRYRSVPRAAYGERDAQAFRRYAQDILGVPEENIILLIGEKATRTDLAKYIEEWLPKNVSKDSRVYFYYSGHGAPDHVKGTAYLVPWDGDPTFLQTSAYPLSHLYAKLGALEAREVVVFLDSCFSGAGGRSLIAANLRPLVAVMDAPATVPKISVLTAASAEEVAGGSDKDAHGLFTYYLLKGLSGEASADKDHVDLDQLYRYVGANVLKAAHRENREQHPRLLTSTRRLRLY